jgi:hypothetical protein
MRRFRLRWLLCGLLVTLMLVTGLWLIFGGRSRRITLEHFEKIQNGMSVDEVNALLGKEYERSQGNSLVEPPLDDMRGWAILIIWLRSSSYSEDDGSWLVPGNEIVVHFTADLDRSKESGLEQDPSKLRVSNAELKVATIRDAWSRLGARIKRWARW